MRLYALSNLGIDRSSMLVSIMKCRDPLSINDIIQIVLDFSNVNSVFPITSAYQSPSCRPGNLGGVSF